MTSEALARIDSAIRSALIDLGDARRCQSLRITPATGAIVRRLDATLAALREARALVPDPPTDDEREALVRDLLDEANHYTTPKPVADLHRRAVEAIRHRGPITGEEIEAAAQAMFEDPDTPGDGYTWAEMVYEDPKRADIWRADARRVLEAVEAYRA